MHELTCTIEEVFKAVTALEGLEFTHDQEQFQRSTINIQDEYGNWINVNGLITKIDHIREITMVNINDEPITIRTANRHKMYDGVNTILVDSIEEHHTFITAQSDELTVITNELQDVVETVYDMSVESETHLYQTADGLIHHNTELARQLSYNLGNLKLLRYDCSEFMEEASITKLMGSSQGYVGYEEGGRLIRDIRKYPHSILLLDEFEKAHPKVQNVFLQILEEAELLGSDGTVADFRNVFILFTTNAGSKNIGKTVGFVNTSNQSKSTKQIEKTFSPEFRNRLDGIIAFNPLGTEQILQVTNKILDGLRDLLKTKNIQLIVTKAAKVYMADKGFDETMGARPMKRVIQQLIKTPVSKEIVIGQLRYGGRVNVGVANGEISLSYTSQKTLDDNKVLKMKSKKSNIS